MGAIQSSLNQLMLTTLGVGMGLSHVPAAQNYTEGRKLAKQSEFYEDAARSSREATKQAEAAGMKTEESSLKATEDIERKALDTRMQWMEHLAQTGQASPQEYAQLKQIGAFNEELAQTRNKIRDLMLSREQEAQEKLKARKAPKERMTWLKQLKASDVRFGKGDPGTSYEELPKELQDKIKAAVKEERAKEKEAKK